MVSKTDIDEEYMLRAIALAKEGAAQGEVPIAALLVDERGVIAAAHNLCELRQDVTAHAEMLVIKLGSEKLGVSRLTGATLYVTIEPCPMCAGAIMHSRIKRLVYGALDSKAGGVHSLFNILTHPSLNHQVQVTGGVLELECASLLQGFFRERR